MQLAALGRDGRRLGPDGARPGRSERPARGRPGRRRHAHPGVAADPAPAARRRRGRGAGLLAPRPAEDRRGPGAATRSSRCGGASPSCCPTSGSRCSRTPASTRARRRTTRATHASSRTGCDLYVNDAFGSAHRAHSSTEAVARLLPAYAGLLLLAELEHLGALLGEVERPFVIVSGGAKVDDKVAVLQNLGSRADEVLIGGKMAEDVRDENPFTFDVVLPIDVVAASEFAADAEHRGHARPTRCPTAGSASTSARRRARTSRGGSRRRETVFWNGPMGVFEWPALRRGHVRRRPGGRRLRRLHRRRRRRLGARGARRGRRRPDLVDLDRRRRRARAARGQGAPRRRGHPGGLTAC